MFLRNFFLGQRQALSSLRYPPFIHFLKLNSLLVTPPDLLFSAFSLSTCVRGTGVSPRVPVERDDAADIFAESESSSLLSNLFMRLPIPGWVGFVADFFSSLSDGVASLNAPKPLRQDGVEERPFSEGAAFEGEEEEERESVFAAAGVEDEAGEVAATPFPTAVGSFSKAFILTLDANEDDKVSFVAAEAAASSGAAAAGVITIFPTRNEAGGTLDG